MLVHPPGLHPGNGIVPVPPTERTRSDDTTEGESSRVVKVADVDLDGDGTPNARAWSFEVEEIDIDGDADSITVTRATMVDVYGDGVPDEVEGRGGWSVDAVPEPGDG